MIFCCSPCGLSAAICNRRKQAEATGEKFTKWDVAERDHGVCGLCFQRIEAGDDLSIDHIIPLSANGKHTWHNVWAPHKFCNSARIAAARRKKNKRRFEQQYPIPYAAIRQ